MRTIERITFVLGLCLLACHIGANFAGAEIIPNSTCDYWTCTGNWSGLDGQTGIAVSCNIGLTQPQVLICLTPSSNGCGRLDNPPPQTCDGRWLDANAQLRTCFVQFKECNQVILPPP
jgi:hypothetical protein